MKIKQRIPDYILVQSKGVLELLLEIVKELDEKEKEKDKEDET